ncbi:MAG: hypothetical protein OXH61_02770 [Acidimicrobiaceae bacterium]|nr:hypothetical protein [Acidimicrobiaceae bacterium]
MATVAQPSPGLHAAVLQAFRSADPWSQSLSSVMSGFVDHLTLAETECLPEAIAGVLPLFRQDRERLRFAGEVLGRLDFFEAAGAVADLAVALEDRSLLLEAASLCGNPAVDPGVRARVSRAVGDDRAGRIRLDPGTVPVSAEEESLYRQCWPGASERDDVHAVAPVAVLDKSLNAAALLQFAVRLDEAGSSLRRLDSTAEIAPWFGPQTVLVCGQPARTRVLSKFQGFSEYQIFADGLPADDRGIVTLLNRINASLPNAHKLNLERGSADPPLVTWAPEVFTAGAYVTKDAAFLAGTTSSSLNYLRRNGLLTPRASGGWYWSFRDVVAVRTWNYLKSISPKRVSSRVVTSLANFAGDSEAAQLGVTSGGNVMVDQGNGWVDVESGETPLDMEISDIDDVFRPFNFGGQTTLDLLQASDNTRLNPTVLHGTPHLTGHRISAKALAKVSRSGDRAVVEAAYPELDGKVFEDTALVGARLLAAV